MIGKIKNLPAGPDLVRLQLYLSGTDGERMVAFELRNLAASNLPDAALLIEAQTGLSVRAKKPIVHLSVSYAPTDRVSPAELMADADRILKALGAQDSQAAIVVHDDHAYQHFHIMLNRVGPDGRCISDSNSKRKIEKILRTIESERGLRPVPGRLAPTVGGSDSNRFNGPRAERRGYIAPPEKVIQAMQTARTRSELDARLAALGWRLEAATPKPGQKAGGLTLRGPGGAKARASDCGRNCSGPALAQRFDPATVQPTAKSQAAPYGPATAPATASPPGRTNGGQALARALKKARAKPRLPKVAPPAPSAIRIIQRVIPTPGLRMKF